jgi:hypothetical protein
MYNEKLNKELYLFKLNEYLVSEKVGSNAIRNNESFKEDILFNKDFIQLFNLHIGNGIYENIYKIFFTDLQENIDKFKNEAKKDFISHFYNKLDENIQYFPFSYRTSDGGSHAVTFIFEKINGRFRVNYINSGLGSNYQKQQFDNNFKVDTYIFKYVSKNVFQKFEINFVFFYPPLAFFPGIVCQVIICTL